MARPSAGSVFSGLTIEGSLLAPAILKLVADRKATDQGDNDYDLPRGVTLRDELSRYFRIGQATFRHLNASSLPSLESAIRFTSDLLIQVPRLSVRRSRLRSGSRWPPLSRQLAGARRSRPHPGCAASGDARRF